MDGRKRVSQHETSTFNCGHDDTDAACRHMGGGRELDGAGHGAGTAATLGAKSLSKHQHSTSRRRRVRPPIAFECAGLDAGRVSAARPAGRVLVVAAGP